MVTAIFKYGHIGNHYLRNFRKTCVTKKRYCYTLAPMTVKYVLYCFGYLGFCFNFNIYSMELEPQTCFNSLSKDIFSHLLTFLKDPQDQLNLLTTCKASRRPAKDGIESTVLKNIKKEIQYLNRIVHSSQVGICMPDVKNKLDTYFSMLEQIVDEMASKMTDETQLRSFARSIALMEYKRSRRYSNYADIVEEQLMPKYNFEEVDFNNDEERESVHSDWTSFFNNACMIFDDFYFLHPSFSLDPNIPLAKIYSYLRNNLKNDYILNQLQDVLCTKIIQTAIHKNQEGNNNIVAHRLFFQILELLELELITNKNDIIDSIQDAQSFLANSILNPSPHYESIEAFDILTTNILERRYTHPVNYIYMEKYWEIIRSILARADALKS